MKRRPLRIEDILHSADAHREITGEWPTKASGPVLDMPGVTWCAIDKALRNGGRELTRGSSLAKLLAEKRGVRNKKALPPLTIEQILASADAHHARTGEWPTRNSGTIPGSGGEKWSAIEGALHMRVRNLTSGPNSLAKLLAEYRGVRNEADLPDLTVEQILAWADAPHARTGAWPNRQSGPIADAPGETWLGVITALRRGNRKLPAYSFALLLAERRGVRNVWSRPNLTIDQVLAWADDHHSRTGQWPNVESGPILAAPGETWGAINRDLIAGFRHLPPGRTLA